VERICDVGAERCECLTTDGGKYKGRGARELIDDGRWRKVSRSWPKPDGSLSQMRTTGSTFVWLVLVLDNNLRRRVRRCEEQGIGVYC